MYDRNKALSRLSGLLKFKTVAGNGNEFEKFRLALKEYYPAVYNACDYEEAGNSGMIFRWKGKTDTESLILMSHYDVVPADCDCLQGESKRRWKYPPFSGCIADGAVWGRGAIDTKCTLCAVFESAEYLIAKGFIPQNDIYFCFGGDEETTGNDAAEIASILKKRGVKPFMVLDEGGGVVDGSVAGIQRQCALIGIAEKGYMDVEFTAKGKGGHSSVAGSSNPITAMAEVVRRVNKGLFKHRLCEAVKIMINSAAGYADFKYRTIMRNYRFFGKVFKKKLIKTLPEITALTNTVGVITRISGGNADNTIAEYVTATGNFRILPGESVSDTFNTIKNAVSDLDVDIKLLINNEPSPTSKTSGKGWEMLTGIIKKTWMDCASIPYLMLAKTDSSSYCELSDSIYRFSPMTLTKAERNLIHGINENIKIESLYTMVEFYIRLISGEEIDLSY